MAKRQGKSPLRIGLVISEVHDGGYYHVYAHPVLLGLNAYEMRVIDSGTDPQSASRSSYDTVRSFYHGDAMVNGFDFDGLTVSSQGENTTRTDERGPRLYGFSVEYRNVFSVDAHRAERMAKTLKTIAKRLEKLNEKFGYHGESFGTYVGRVANAIGAEQILFDVSKSKRGYDEADWRRYNIGDGVSQINYMIRNWAEPKETAVANAAC